MEIKSHFDHVNFNVTDLERNRKFYKEALGLEKVGEIDHPNGDFKIVYLSRPGESFRLELTWLRDPLLPLAARPRPSPHSRNMIMHLRIVLAIVFFGLCHMAGMAEFYNEFSFEGLVFNIIDRENRLCEVPYQREGHDFTDVVIPSEVEHLGVKYKVVAIGSSAFYCKCNITSVFIPESVTSIGDFAFGQCEKLKSLSIPESVTAIGNETFARSGLESILLPSSLLSLGDNAFAGCRDLRTITLPKSLQLFGNSLFEGCRSLVSIEVDENNDKLSSQNGILYNKDMTELIAYPIGQDDESFDIPEGVVSIADDAFYIAEKLTQISLPRSLRKIGSRAMKETSLHSVVFCEGLSEIGDEAFACTQIPHLILPESVTSVGDRAFSGCSLLQDVYIPDSVSEIGQFCFAWCGSLKSVRISESLDYISDGCFNYCIELTSIEDGNSLKSLGNEAFSDCLNLKTLSLPEGLESIGNSCFARCYFLQDIALPPNISFLGRSAFLYCSSLSQFSIPLNIEEIPEGCFEASGLKTIVIPENIVSIRESAFAGCSDLQEVLFPSTIGEIDKSAFRWCSSLKSLEFTSIGINIDDDAFTFCDNLTTIKFLTKWLFLGSGVFRHSNKIRSITSTSWNPGKIPIDAFSHEVFENCILYVPVEYIDIYTEKEYWNKFAHIVPLDENEVDAVEDEVSDVEIYTLEGHRINRPIKNLPSGLYILCSGGKTKKIKI